MKSTIYKILKNFSRNRKEPTKSSTGYIQVTKNQHYVPVFCLKNFTNSDGKLFETYLLKEIKKVYPTNPIVAMSQKYTYEDPHLMKNSLENDFQQIESHVAPKIISILDELNKFENEEVGIHSIKSEIDDLMRFFIIFYYRSGALLTEFSSGNKKFKVALLLDKLLNRSYIYNLADTIKNYYNFAVIKSDGEFLISDQYVSTAAIRIKSRFVGVTNRHVGLKEMMILIPLSSSYYCMYWNSNNPIGIEINKINSLNKDLIEDINRVIINNSYMKCVGQKREILEKALACFQFRSPSTIFVGYKSGYNSGAVNKKEVFFDKSEEKAYELLEFSTFIQYKKLGRNDQCACGSGEKYKKCHRDAYERIMEVMQTFNGKGDFNDYVIPGVTTIELPIEEWGGYTKNSDKK